MRPNIPRTPASPSIGRAAPRFREFGNGVLKAVRVLTAFRPGPMAFRPDGSLLVAVPASSTGPAALLDTADAGVTWQDVSDAFYRSTGGFATDMTVGPDRLVYVSTFGDGVLVGHG